MLNHRAGIVNHSPASGFDTGATPTAYGNTLEDSRLWQVQSHPTAMVRAERLAC